MHNQRNSFNFVKTMVIVFFSQFSTAWNIWLRWHKVYDDAIYIYFSIKFTQNCDWNSGVFVQKSRRKRSRQSHCIDAVFVQPLARLVIECGRILLRASEVPAEYCSFIWTDNFKLWIAFVDPLQSLERNSREIHLQDKNNIHASQQLWLSSPIL